MAATPAEVAATADVTITMLADDDAVAHVYGGDDGLLAGARRGAVLVDLSTVTPEALRAFEPAARAAGGRAAGRAGRAAPRRWRKRAS